MRNLTLNILIADDASVFRNFVKSSITSANIDANFIEVDDGKHLFSTYENNVPEITIVDYKLPSTNVLGFARKILDIHPIAIIIVFVDVLNHEFVREAKEIGIKEIQYRTIGQFALGTMIKKIVAKSIPKFADHEQKMRQNVMNALTMTTLDRSNNSSPYVRLTNATLQRRIENIEKLKNFGGDFETTIKSLYETNNAQKNTANDSSESIQTRVNSTSKNGSNFFIRELSNDQLVVILREKIKQLKETKADLESTNDKLNDVVSELEETKQELTIQKERLEEQVRTQTSKLLKTEKLTTIGELSARIAHDLNNPFNVIKNTTEILKSSLSDRLTDYESEQWKRLDRSMYRMAHQIDEVLDFIKQRPLQKTKTQLSVLLADVLERIPIPPNIEIHVPQNDTFILCDSTKIEIVFSNLILNAIQAINGAQGLINIVLGNDSSSSDIIEIEIQDTGPGIPENLRERVFDPLFTTRQVGTCLGLTSCKRIVEAHGGTISFESKIGVGTIFFIRLPNKTEWDNIQKTQTIKI